MKDERRPPNCRCSGSNEDRRTTASPPPQCSNLPPAHCNAYAAPSEGGFIGREEKMAGKNDCGIWRERVGGNIWRETGGGKRVAGQSWRKHMAGNGWRKTGGGEKLAGKYWGESVAWKYIFPMSKMDNGCTVFISQNFKKKSFQPNISKRVERDSMVGDIGGKNCS